MNGSPQREARGCLRRHAVPIFIVSLTAFSNGDDKLAFPVFRRRHGLIEAAYAARVEKND